MSLADQIAAATAETRTLMGRAIPGAEHAPCKAQSAWSAEVLDRLCTPTAPRCRHLARRPIQPAFAFIWEGHWRCRRCVQDHAQAEHKAMQNGTWRGLGSEEEGTCDRCRTEVGPNLLTATVLRTDMFVVQAAICPRCERTLVREGGRLLGTAP